MVTSSIPGRRG